MSNAHGDLFYGIVRLVRTQLLPNICNGELLSSKNSVRMSTIFLLDKFQGT